MCNELHRGVRSETAPIPSFGFGYKIFRRKEIMQYPEITVRDRMDPAVMLPDPTKKIVRFESMLQGPYAYGKDPANDLIVWNPASSLDWFEEGFCFFLTRFDAIQAMKVWTAREGLGMQGCRSNPEENAELEIRRIRYEGGIGACTEFGFVSGHPIRMGLCRAFIMEEHNQVRNQEELQNQVQAMGRAFRGPGYGY